MAVSGCLHAAAWTAAREQLGDSLQQLRRLHRARPLQQLWLQWTDAAAAVWLDRLAQAELSLACCSAAVTRQICSEQQQWERTLRTIIITPDLGVTSGEWVEAIIQCWGWPPEAAATPPQSQLRVHSICLYVFLHLSPISLSAVYDVGVLLLLLCYWDRFMSLSRCMQWSDRDHSISPGLRSEQPLTQGRGLWWSGLRFRGWAVLQALQRLLCTLSQLGYFVSLRWEKPVTSRVTVMRWHQYSKLIAWWMRKNIRWREKIISFDYGIIWIEVGKCSRYFIKGFD